MRNAALEDTSIPSEAESIKEVTLKCAELQRQLLEVTDKNRTLTASLEYMQRDLKSKIPMLNMRKNDYQSTLANYQAIKAKLALSIKTTNNLANEKQSLHLQIDELLRQKVRLTHYNLF